MPITVAAERDELRRLLGGIAIATKTADYTALTSDFVLLCDASSGALTITLPSVASNPGNPFYVKRLNSGANTVTIAAVGSDLIDGSSTAVLNSRYETLLLVAEAGSWHVI